eukprot:c24632_g1_i2 orf=500-1336(-)
MMRPSHSGSQQQRARRIPLLPQLESFETALLPVLKRMLSQDVESLTESILSPSGDHVSHSIFSATALSEPGAIASAVKHLRELDAKLRSVIDVHEGPQFKKCESAFRSLLRSIVCQQLASKVADTIYGRLVSMCGGEMGITPDSISRLPAAEMRSIGISERKASYLHDLARNFTSGVLSDSTINLMDDEALMSSLTAVKGIGVWTVHMFMIFALNKPDVLPVGDLGIKKGFQKLYNLKSLPTAAEMVELASCWRPYRSLGSWYMWRLMSTKAPIPKPQ